ncbi:hypothetical protein NP233_g7046 [Leucocoprinus birnbaumii]|uniref:Uncharacterized protein n=1 Tax=Leucocoprinus birnbaumii TaxID=56174 RepID=A0AAD5YUZ5_9AGAR|nr:hypothetical protein NP233_g7046 [Leucocoprinus birnbaumii]
MPRATPSESRELKVIPITIGIIFQALINGGLLTLGITCFFLLSIRNLKPKLVKHSKFWRLFIVLILVLNLALLVIVGYDFIHSILSRRVTASPHSPTTLVGLILIEIIGCLNDGVLVWRCYMVHHAIGPSQSSKLTPLFWIFPLCLYTIAVVAGIIAAVAGLTGMNYRIFFACAGTALITLDLLIIYATTYITIRLLRHRRIAKVFRGSSGPQSSEHFRLVRILLESAAINVPMVIFATVVLTLGSPSYNRALLWVRIGFQSFATLLILHQVALGKTIDQVQAHSSPQGSAQSSITALEAA